MKYVDEFLALKCAGDVINAAAQLKKNGAKEISEAMAMVSAMRHIVLEKPGEYTLYDLFSGNCIVAVTAIHLLPLKYAYSVDIQDRRVRTDVKNYEHLKIDVGEMRGTHLKGSFGGKHENIIITACHCCKDLAFEAIRLFEELDVTKHLIMMPCCEGSIPGDEIPHLIKKQLGGYLAWCYYLYRFINNGSPVKASINRDSHCISPCNVIIKASWELPF